MVKSLPTMKETWVKVLGSGRSPGEGNGNLLQYSYLKNSMDREAWQATVHGVAKRWTRLSMHVRTHTHTHTHILCSAYAEKRLMSRIFEV